MKSRRLISDIRISFVVKSARNFHERSYNLNPVKAVYWLSVIFLAALFLMQCFFGVMMADKTVYKFDNLVFFCNCDKLQQILKNFLQIYQTDKKRFLGDQCDTRQSCQMLKQKASAGFAIYLFFFVFCKRNFFFAFWCIRCGGEYLQRFPLNLLILRMLFLLQVLQPGYQKNHNQKKIPSF